MTSEKHAKKALDSFLNGERSPLPALSRTLSISRSRAVFEPPSTNATATELVANRCHRLKTSNRLFQTHNDGLTTTASTPSVICPSQSRKGNVVVEGGNDRAAGFWPAGNMSPARNPPL